MIEAHTIIIQAAKDILGMARSSLLRRGSFSPAAFLHTCEGLIAIVMLFENNEQKRIMTDFVRKRATEVSAHAVTTVTCAGIVDSRTGEESESLVAVTAIQGGSPHVMVQPVIRDRDKIVLFFGDVDESGAAAMPGQMMILPDWGEGTSHGESG